MLGDLVQQFLGSGAAKEAIGAVTNRTQLDEGQARDAVQATAEGAAEAAAGKGGVGGLLDSLGGGGGLAGLAGGLLGGSGGGSTDAIPAEIVDTVASFVASRTGLAEGTAKQAVRVALPHVLGFFKKKAGGSLGKLFG